MKIYYEILSIERIFFLAIFESVVFAHQYCDDVAIVGAGVGGSYTAWKLRNKGLRVTLYEYSNRVGGRYHTANFERAPYVNLDVGAMRYNPDVHKRLAKAINDLGLATRSFPFGPYSPPEVYYTRNHWFRRNETVSKAPYFLPRRVSREEIKWRILTRNTTFNPITDVDTLELRRSLQSDDGVKLRDQWISTFYSKYATTEEYAYMRDLAAFEDISEVPADMNIAISNPNDKSGPTYPTRTVVAGFQFIAKSMVREFTECSDGNSLRLNRKLVQMRRKSNGEYTLTFVNPETNYRKIGCARRVVLASSLTSLQELDFEPFASGEIRNILDNAMKKISAWKIYLGYDTQWWNKSKTPVDKYTVSNTPLRQSYVFGKNQANDYHVLLASYANFQDTLPIWKDVFQQGSKFPTAENDNTLAITDVTVDLCRKYFAELYDLKLSDVPRPLQAICYPVLSKLAHEKHHAFTYAQDITVVFTPGVFVLGEFTDLNMAYGSPIVETYVGKIWSGEPYDAAWYEYTKGFNISYVSEKMLKPSDTDEVYIANSIYNIVHYNWWSEAALQNAERVLEMMGYPVQKIAVNDNYDHARFKGCP